ncbi:hypothetical protein ONZ51_g3634 [Trametes cubensis]|uniref:Uncharacterized protein n=1 Tax=Trametes cubensis TaxID=1111947 RepID=A0AAD7TYH0_9APHY|nr:hypothetical protein ONZ51_g3634 [Trametes cubensis]
MSTVYTRKPIHPGYLTILREPRNTTGWGSTRRAPRARYDIQAFAPGSVCSLAAAAASLYQDKRREARGREAWWTSSAPHGMIRVSSVIGSLVDMMGEAEDLAQFNRSSTTPNVVQTPGLLKRTTSSYGLPSTVCKLRRAEESKPIASVGDDDFIMMRPLGKARLSQPLDIIAESVDESITCTPSFASQSQAALNAPTPAPDKSFKLHAMFWTPPPNATSLAEVAKEYLRIAERPRPALRGRPGPFLHAIHEEEKATTQLPTQTMGHPMIRTKGKKGTPRRPKTRSVADENAL